MPFVVNHSRCLSRKPFRFPHSLRCRSFSCEIRAYIASPRCQNQQNKPFKKFGSKKTCFSMFTMCAPCRSVPLCSPPEPLAFRYREGAEDIQRFPHTEECVQYTRCSSESASVRSTETTVTAVNQRTHRQMKT